MFIPKIFSNGSLSRLYLATYRSIKTYVMALLLLIFHKDFFQFIRE